MNCSQGLSHEFLQQSCSIAARRTGTGSCWLLLLQIFLFHAHHHHHDVTIPVTALHRLIH